MPLTRGVQPRFTAPGWLFASLVADLQPLASNLAEWMPQMPVRLLEENQVVLLRH